MDSKTFFYVEAYDFICGLLEHMQSVSFELSKICTRDYNDKFIVSRETINRLNKNITFFLSKWKDYNDDNICDCLKSIKDYYSFYFVSLSNSSPSMYSKDSKYIIDSIATATLVLNCKLKKIKQNL